MATTHTPQHESIDDWFKAFYAVSDDGTAHEAYPRFFAEDAKLIMGDKVAVGREGMTLAFLHSLILIPVWSSLSPVFRYIPLRFYHYGGSHSVSHVLTFKAPLLTKSEILKLRTGMWAAVARRHHKFEYFANPQLPHTNLLQGTVKYTFKDGKEGDVEWVAKAVFEGEGEGRRLGFYQVFLNAGKK